MYAGRPAGGYGEIAGGTLRATGDVHAAGIGGGAEANGGTVAVHGGTVYAKGGYYAAGIGGGFRGSGGTVTVHGGTVYAEGGEHAAGIGGGDRGAGGDVAIYGGTVAAVGGQGARLGIGGGHGGNQNGELDLGTGVSMWVKSSLDGGDWSTLQDDVRKPVMSTGDVSASVKATFDANGHGSTPQAQTVPFLGKFTRPNPEPSVEGYVFAGWHADEGCTIPFDFDARAFCDVHVWAKWEQKQIQVIPVPEAKAGLVYNGEPQAGVAAGAGYSVEGGSATNAGSYTATLTADSGHVFEGGDATATVDWSIAKADIAVPKAKSGLVYNGKPQAGVAAGAGYSAKGNSATDAGSHTATLTADSNHVFEGGKATATVAWSIAKAANTLAAKAKTKKAVPVKAGKSLKAGKLLKVSGAKGKVTYKKASGSKKITVDKKTGKVTVAKGCKAGAYALKVKVRAAGDANYKASAWKTVKVKVLVK